MVTLQKGQRLGYVDRLLVLPYRLMVVSADLKGNWLPTVGGVGSISNIPLQSIQQIGDVILAEVWDTASATAHQCVLHGQS